MPQRQSTLCSERFSPLQRGFTLVEIMIVVGIVAILASLAIPSYRDYMMRGNVPEATSRLAGLQVRMEQLFQDRRSYATATDAGQPCAADTTTSRYFNFDCAAAPTATGFTLRASGKNSMSGFVYTITERSVRASTTAPTSTSTSTPSRFTSRRATAARPS